MCTTFLNKKHYVVEVRYFVAGLKHGLKLTKIYRLLEYKQAKWLKPHIEFNTAQPALSKTKFKKDMYRFLNNMVYRKMLENVQKYKDIKICHPKELLKYSTKNTEISGGADTRPISCLLAHNEGSDKYADLYKRCSAGPQHY